MRLETRKELLAESKKHQVSERLRQIPSIGPIRVAVLLGIMQTPHRFRTKRQLRTYSGFAVEGHSSANHQVVNGQLQRKKKQIEIRGLNKNFNHHLKNLFKGAATNASTKPGPFREFYADLVAKGMRPEMARLALARKIAGSQSFDNWVGRDLDCQLILFGRKVTELLYLAVLQRQRYDANSPSSIRPAKLTTSCDRLQLDRGSVHAKPQASSKLH